MENSVRLTCYHEQYDEALANFALKGEQFTFTKLPAEVIEEAIHHPDKDPIVILQAEQPVGFFILHQNSEYVDEAESSQAILMRAFSISIEYQGKGYAITAMKLLPEFIRQLHPEIKEIILAVNEGNVAAQQLYLKVGFLTKGVRRMSHHHGLQLIFQLEIV